MPQHKSDLPGYGDGPGSYARRDDSSEITADHAEGAAARAQEIAGGLAEQVRACADQVRLAARNFQPFAERSMRERPLSTLAAGAAIGFVLGALWKR